MTTELISEYLEVLQELGYNFRQSGESLRTQAVYRGGDGYNLAIYPKAGMFIDFVTNTKGNLIDLISLSLGRDTNETIQYLEQKLKKNIRIKEFFKETAPKIRVQKKVSDNLVHELQPIYDFYINKGIKEDVLKEFNSGFCSSGFFKNRFCLPIYDENNKLIGMTGRLTYYHDKQPKWKHKGEVKNFIFPIHLNKKIIEEKDEVILVESPFCVLKLYNLGVKNVLCLFGTKLQNGILNYLLHTNCNIIISTNNEPSGIGNSAAIKIKQKLNKYFDYKKSKIKLPTKKDFGEMTDDEIREWIRS